MSSFSSILTSLQDGKPIPPIIPSKPPLAIQKKDDNRTPNHQSHLKNAAAAAAAAAAAPASVKRKLDHDESGSSRKAAKVTHNAPLRHSTTVNKPIAQNVPASPKANAIRASGVSTQARSHAAGFGARLSSQGAIARPSLAVANSAGNTAPPRKRGFASLMAKAAAAQEASKASGPDIIKHKSVEKLSKREKQRQAQEAEQAAKQRKQGHGQAGRQSQANGDKPGKLRPAGKEVPKMVYHGTMRANAAADRVPKKPRKGQAQDKYGGYASWSDLDEAEDEEGSYESESDMEEAGYDDMMEEELRSARMARKEDEEAQAEEERHKQEKLERKKRLMALSNSAASAKKRF